MLQTSQQITCAVVHAGPDTLLAITSRDGRFPINVLSTASPVIAWCCADGSLEHVSFEGARAQGDHATLLRDLGRDGILFAEVSDLLVPDSPDATYHLVEIKPQENIRERAQ